MKGVKGFIFFCFVLLSQVSNAQDSVWVRPKVKYGTSFFQKLFLGKHYRELWNMPVKVEVFHVDKEQGGLKPVKLGGGLESVSLRLEDKDKRTYTLRLLEKDPSKALNPFFKKSFWGKAIKEQNSANNPYAASVVPKLAKSVGITHAMPRLVYVPYDSSFGIYKENVADHLAYFEPRPGENNKDLFDIEHAKKVVGTDKMFEKLYDNNKNQVDQKLYLKCRLFDMVISDWGRHADQWRWAAYDVGKETIYKPIPRDRDHAFYLFDDGIIPWIYVHTFQSKYQSFTRNYKSIKGLNLSARALDERLLNELTLKDWLTVADELQTELSDELIDSIIRTWPTNVYSIVGDATIEKLKYRRDHLIEVACQSYSLLAKRIIISGSDKEEEFYINGISNFIVEVTVLDGGSKNNDEHKSDTLFHRLVDTRQTSYLYLYGLNGDDVFVIDGLKQNKIHLQIAGGRGEDKYFDNSYAKKIRIVDSKDGNTFQSNKHSKIEYLYSKESDVMKRKGYKAD